MSFINTTHRAPYPSIQPTRPALSQAGQTVLVTGGAQGIGYSISQAFAKAGAAAVVIASRSAETIASAAGKIKEEVPGFTGTVVGKVCDVASLESTRALWEELRREGIVVDVLVLNAAKSLSKGPLVDEDIGLIWDEFTQNVRGNIDFAQRFVKQNRASPNGHKKALLNVSSLVIHDFAVMGGTPNYSLTKNASKLAMQQIAKDTASDEVQIISFHPGAIYTDAARRNGVTKDHYPFDSDDLPGAFSLWAASSEAQFLHGRFVWAAWDVEEMKHGEVAKRIQEEPNFLTVGVPGLLNGSQTVV